MSGRVVGDTLCPLATNLYSTGKLQCHGKRMSMTEVKAKAVNTEESTFCHTMPHKEVGQAPGDGHVDCVAGPHHTRAPCAKHVIPMSRYSPCLQLCAQSP